ncbi:MAG TPA: PaaI family thioesterase, partial [Rhizomicrobium sp.]|nr:PaaI family thioesterase [Rhizomicrobium sp.]
VPYCAWLGMTARIEDGALILDLPFDGKLIGNPILPALHGGVTGSLLETAAIVQILWETGGTALPKPVDITIDYLRSGRAVTSHARAWLARQGRRVVSARAEMWQDDETKPVASFRGHFLLA